jgi:hypothetical protein
MREEDAEDGVEPSICRQTGTLHYIYLIANRCVDQLSCDKYKYIFDIYYLIHRNYRIYLKLIQSYEIHKIRLIIGLSNHQEI